VLAGESSHRLTFVKHAAQRPNIIRRFARHITKITKKVKNHGQKKKNFPEKLAGNSGIARQSPDY
jgi:hypothetical protein